MEISRPVLYVLGCVILSSLALNVWFIQRTPALPAVESSQQAAARMAVLPTRPQRPDSESSWQESQVERLHRAVVDGTNREEITRQFSKWAETNPAAALEWVEEHTEGDLNRELTLCGIGIWARVDPAASAEWVGMLPLGAKREQAASRVISEWGAIDGFAAAQWLDTINNGPLTISAESKLAAANILASVWSSYQAISAVEWARDFAGKHDGSAAFHLSLTSLAGSDPVAARNFYNSLQQEEERAIAAESIGRGMAMARPEEAFAWALELGSGETGWLARNAVFNQWTLDQPSQAALHLSSIGDADEYAHHISTLMTNWTANDADAAERWAVAQEPGMVRDQAIKGLAENYFTASPRKALDLSLTIADPSLRLEVAGGVLASWREENRANADSWLANTTLDPDLKSALSEEHSADSE